MPLCGAGNPWPPVLSWLRWRWHPCPQASTGTQRDVDPGTPVQTPAPPLITAAWPWARSVPMCPFLPLWRWRWPLVGLLWGLREHVFLKHWAQWLGCGERAVMAALSRLSSTPRSASSVGARPLWRASRACWPVEESVRLKNSHTQQDFKKAAY